MPNDESVLAAQPDRASAAEMLAQMTPRLAHTATRQFFAIHQAGPPPGVPLTVDAVRAEVTAHLERLTHALRTNEPRSFADYVRAVSSGPTELAVHGEQLVRLLELVGQLIREKLGEQVWAYVVAQLDPALQELHPDDWMPDDRLLSDPQLLMPAYLMAVLNGRRIQAQSLVLDALQKGMTIRQVYLDVFQPSLYEVGALWERGQLSIAKEHLATAITQSILSRVYADVSLAIHDEQQAIVACLTGNQHEIGPRMLADFLQLAEFNTRFLGANTPLHSLIELIDEVKPDVIGLPASTPDHVAAVKDAIQHLRTEFTTYHPTIMVGGLAFNLEDGLWRQVGGDVWGRDAGEAIDHLVGNSTWS